MLTYFRDVIKFKSFTNKRTIFQCLVGVRVANEFKLSPPKIHQMTSPKRWNTVVYIILNRFIKFFCRKFEIFIKLSVSTVELLHEKSTSRSNKKVPLHLVFLMNKLIEDSLNY